MDELKALTPWFWDNGELRKRIPKDTVRQCARSGHNDETVEYWVKRLKFDAPREKAIAYLAEFGAWDRPKLEAMTQKDINEKVLWIACWDIREEGQWYGLNH